MSHSPVVILGAGPAGLTAAYELAKRGIRSVVVERDGIVGGISQTANYKGYRFDIGGHRFFTKVKPVEDLWKEVLGDDLIKRSRLSRIFYKGKFFSYPLKPANALFGLGLIETTRCMCSYLYARVFPIKPENSFEDWVTNRFGRRLFEIFFKTYTEKVWGIPTHEIEAEWAAQRIKGLSLTSAIKNALLGERAKDKGAVIKTLIDEFLYPRLGPGMMWERTAELVEHQGSQVALNKAVEEIHWTDETVSSIRAGGSDYSGEDYISSIAIRDLVEAMRPAPPEEVLVAARRLNYRDFLTVALIIDKDNIFPDTWIYIHESSVKVGRIQNFKNWSPEMVPEAGKSCLGLEYFCFEGDELWSSDDATLIDLATRELGQLGLVDSELVSDGVIVRMPKAYPVYDHGYADSVTVVRDWLARFGNLQLVGRNGMHRYNNQDHSMLTAMMAAMNISGSRYDLWNVNVDDEYHEEGREITLEDLRAIDGTQPLVPKRIDA